MTQELPVWMQNNAYSARLDRGLIAALMTEGVINGLVVTQRGAGANMSVDISAGRAIIGGDDQANQGSYLAVTTVLENVAIGAAPGSNSRIDLVYYRVNDPNAGGPAGSTSAFGVVAGTPAASPSVPALPTSAIPLAQVLVATGTVSITNAMITDVRAASVVSGQVPPGSLMPYVGAEASVPTGWLLCRGQSYDTTVNFGLFRVLGVGTLPDLRGRIPVGLDNMGGSDAGRLSVANTLLSTGGAETVTLTTAEMPAHTHTVADHTHAIDHNHASVTSGIQSADHYHFINGNTGTVADHVHSMASGFSVLVQTLSPTLDYIEVEAVADGNDIIWGTAGPNTLGAGAHQHAISLNSNNQSANHTHDVDLPNFTGSSGLAGAQSTSSVGTGSAFSKMPPYILVNYIIKT